MGGGISGSVIGGGSIYQIDVWHMGGNPLPARALVKGRRLGLVAEVGTAHAALLVTGCQTAKEMDKITSSGLDWEFAIGLKGSNIVKTGSKLFKILAEASLTTADWAMHESSKRFVQWAMDDLGVVQDGRQFNLIPSPLSIGLGAGLFYEWQTLHLAGGKIGWQHISPKWRVYNKDGDVWLEMEDVPEQNGEQIKFGFYVPEWGIDPILTWSKRRDGGALHIIGYAHSGKLHSRRDGKGPAGINLSDYAPKGRSEAGWLSVKRTSTVKKSGSLKVQPAVFDFGNYPYWTADDTMTVDVDDEGRFTRVEGKTGFRD